MRMMKTGTTGLDVRRVQAHLHVVVDGVFGPKTEAAVRAFQRVHGLTVDGVVGPQTWNALFPKAKVATSGKPTAKPSSAGARAVVYAESFQGVKEHPAGSNSGPHITDWLRAVDCPPAPWCGAFMHAVLDHIGVKGITSRMRYVPWIVADGRAGVNGFVKVVSIDEARAGDLVCFDWEMNGVADHVGMFTGMFNAGQLVTIEGNTTAEGAAGNQSNGGQVAIRNRPRSTVAAIVRPRYS